MQPYQLRFAVSSTEALAKLPPRFAQLAHLKLHTLAASLLDEPAPEDGRPLRLFEIPPFAFAYVVDRDLRSIVLERVYLVLRGEAVRSTSWARLLAFEDAGPQRH